MSITTTDRNISSLNPVAQTACNLFMSKCKEAGLNVLITETRRSRERQNYLYCQGRTVAQATAKGIDKEFATKYCNPNASQVTWTLNSNHKSGMAWDICKNIRGQEYSDSAFFKKCGAIAKELGITWGGTWDTPDTPHFEVKSSWVAPATVTKEEEYKVTKTKIELNGVVKEVEAINVNGNNFVKLRDISDNKISVIYDATKKMPVVKSK